MRDDVAVRAIRKMELDGQSARACQGVIVRYRRNSGEVGEAHRHGYRSFLQVRRSAEGCGGWTRSEVPLQNHALGMYGARARMLAEDTVQDIDELRRRSARGRDRCLAAMNEACNGKCERKTRGGTNAVVRFHV